MNHASYTPVVSFIGRPNVGKSTLFNRLMRDQQRAITFDLPGVTRDRHYGVTTLKEVRNLSDQEVILVDTGGFYPQQIDESMVKEREELFFNVMAEHAKIAISESDLVLLVVDAREGFIPFDKQIVSEIRRANKEFWVLVNKYDSDKQSGEEIQFYSLGIDEEQMVVTSGAHNLGIEELRTRLHKRMSVVAEERKGEIESLDLQLGVRPYSDVVSSIALIGGPNAGKSTLLNCIVGAKRALVSDIAGTTVDPIEGYFEMYFRGDDIQLLAGQENEFRNGASRGDAAILREYKQVLPELQDLQKNTYSLDDDEELDGDLEDFELEEEGDIFSDRDYAELLANDQLIEEEAELVEEEVAEEEPVVEGALRSLKIVDTAGIRRQSNIKGKIESMSVFRALRAITEAEIVVMVIDATKGISHQDRRLADIAIDKGKSIILCLNKMDLLWHQLKDRNKRKEWLEDMRAKIPWLSYCEIVTLSAKRRKNIKALKNALRQTVMVRNRPLPTSRLNKIVYSLVENHPIILKGSRGLPFKIRYASNVKTNPPTILFFANKTKDIPMNYRRYLQNAIRREFQLVNTPVHLIFRNNRDLGK